MVNRNGNIFVTNKVPGTAKGPQVEDISEFIEESPWSGDYAVFNALIYAEPGEGKTPLIATVADVPQMMPALLIDCDSGTLSARKHQNLHTIHLAKFSAQKGVSAWRALELIYGWLLYGDHEYKTVMLDGGTDLQRYCELDCIVLGAQKKDEGGKDHDDELAELADYRRIQERMKRTYMRFRDLVTKDGRRINFIATAHEGKLKDNWTGAISIQPLYLGKGAVMITSVFDIVARLVTDDKGKKYLVPSLEGKARGRDRSFALGDRLESPTMGKIFERIHSMGSPPNGQKEKAHANS